LFINFFWGGCTRGPRSGHFVFYINNKSIRKIKKSQHKIAKKTCQGGSSGAQQCIIKAYFVSEVSQIEAGNKAKAK
jgi:hypothetical protein